MSNIKYFCFGKTSAYQPIFFCNGLDNQKIDVQVKNEVGKVLEQIKGLNLSPDERQKIETSNGCYFYKYDNQQIFYLVLASRLYPERLAYQLIKKMQEHMNILDDYGQEEDQDLKIHAKMAMNDLAIQYEDPSKIDKISEAQAHVDDVKLVVEDNIKKIIDNQGDLQNLQGKTSAMSNAAQQFNRNSHDLERIMYWRNMKLKIIIILVIIGLLCYIIIPIIVSASSSDDSGGSQKSQPNNNINNSTNLILI